MLRGFIPRYYEGDGGANPQGGSAQDDPPIGKQQPSDVLDRLGRDPLKLAEKLAEALEDNYKLRDERRRLKAERGDLEKRLAPEGAVILTSDDAAAWAAYRELGSAADLKTALAERADLAGKVAKRERQDQIVTAAKVAGFDADVLATLVGDAALTVKELGEGKDRKAVAYIAGSDGKEHALTDYAAQAWGKFLPALAPQQRSGDGVGSPAGGRKPLAVETAPRPRVTF